MCKINKTLPICKPWSVSEDGVSAWPVGGAGAPPIALLVFHISISFAHPQPLIFLWLPQFLTGTLRLRLSSQILPLRKKKSCFSFILVVFPLCTGSKSLLRRCWTGAVAQPVEMLAQSLAGSRSVIPGTRGLGQGEC